MHRSLSPALAALLSTLALLAAAPIASAAPRDHFTPVAAEVLSPPEPALGGDGRVHVEYELILTNHSFPPAKETVKSIRVMAGDRVLATLAGKRLAAVTKAFDSTEFGPVLNPGVGGFVVIDLSFPRGTKLPRRIVHQISVTQKPPSSVIQTTYRAAPTSISRRRAIVIAPPLRGPGWVIGNGCCAEPTSHRSGVLAINGALFIGERFAIDFFQLIPGGSVSAGPHDRLSSYPYFGDEVLAAAAGRVVDVVNDLPEGPIDFELPPITAADAGGNHVTVALGHRRYAYYAHLQPGSVRVAVGDRVTVGQTLGLLGNSGNSNAPHLHFQLMSGRVPLGSNGVPFTFSRFRSEGTLKNFAPVLVLGAKGKIDPKPAGIRHRALPLDNEVVGF
jgi:hypothetical protein